MRLPIWKRRRLLRPTLLSLALLLAAPLGAAEKLGLASWSERIPIRSGRPVFNLGKLGRLVLLSLHQETGQ